MMSEQERICKKFEITPDHPGYKTALLLDRNRTDRTYFLFPYECPDCINCGEALWDQWYDTLESVRCKPDLTLGRKLTCKACGLDTVIDAIYERDGGPDRDGNTHQIDIVNIRPLPEAKDEGLQAPGQ